MTELQITARLKSVTINSGCVVVILTSISLRFSQTGGLGNIHIPLLSDLNKQISRDYGVLLEGAGIALRYVHRGLEVFYSLLVLQEMEMTVN